MLAVCSRRARYQVKQALEVSVEPQGQFLGLPFFNLLPDVSAIRLQKGKLAGNNYCFLRRAGLQDQVYTGIRVHKNTHT